MGATIAIPAVLLKTNTLPTSATAKAINIGFLFQELVSCTLLTTPFLQTIFHNRYRHCRLHDIRLLTKIYICCMQQFKCTSATSSTLMHLVSLAQNCATTGTTFALTVNSGNALFTSVILPDVRILICLQFTGRLNRCICKNCGKP